MGLVGLDDPDRGVRAQMVRLISGQRVPQAAVAMRRALADPARRVRKLAAKLSGPFIGDEAVEERLRELFEDANEITKIRTAAFLVLSSGKFLTSLADSPDDAKRFFDDVPALASYRQQALNVLVSLDPLTDAARDLLRYVVDTGTREEAVDATRALCGFRVLHIGALPPGERRRVAQTSELARGRVFYWVPRSQ
jgi:hypothetical protein